MAVPHKSNEHDDREEHLELPVEELLRRARPMPSPDAMALHDVAEDEGEAFLAAVSS